MSMKSNDLFRTLSTDTTGRPPFRRKNDIEVDDTAPIPLFIGIGLPIVIGIVILVLICCFCRRRRNPARGIPANQMANAAIYQRAPEADGIGQEAYPMTTVPNSYPGYPPPGQPTAPMHYTPVPPGVRPPMHPPAYPSQQVPPPSAAQFVGYPPPQYIPVVSPPPHLTAPPGQHPSMSHSSQASSASGHTVDPLVQAVSPATGQPYLLQQHHHHPQQQQQHFYHPHLPSSGLSRESPAPFHYMPSHYVLAAHPHQGLEPLHNATTTPLPTSPLPQTPLISSPVGTKSPPPTLSSKTALRDDGTDQDLGYSEGEE